MMNNQHPQRSLLNDEIHVRPYDLVQPPERVSYMAFYTANERAEDYASLLKLCEHYQIEPPSADSNYWYTEFANLRLKWERHTEFTSYTFFQQGEFEHPFENPVISQLPADWLKTVNGQLLVAAHLAIQRGSANPQMLAPLFNHNYLIGSKIGDGVAHAFSDLKIHEDGFSRFLILDLAMTPRQAGRMVQRLLEMEVYRMLALMTLPLARRLSPQNEQLDHQLANITTKMGLANSDDELLLDELSQIAATVEQSISSSDYRFSAARAYFTLVSRRITDLREQRIQGFQTFKEFMDRRFTPAMDTCESVSRRLESLSKRINRAGQLLRTKVDIRRQKHNQALLASMDKRAHLQLRLQETVEGLSVAAITYYMVSLIGYVAKGLKPIGIDLHPELVMGLSIPLVALVIGLGVRHVRHGVQKDSKDLNVPDL